MLVDFEFAGSCPRRFGGVLFGGDHRPQLVRADAGDLAAGDLPLVVLFDDARDRQTQEHCVRR
jgi:hypothetical protein